MKLNYDSASRWGNPPDEKPVESTPAYVPEYPHATPIEEIMQAYRLAKERKQSENNYYKRTPQPLSNSTTPVISEPNEWNAQSVVYGKSTIRVNPNLPTW